jgi:hypothetical protein
MVDIAATSVAVVHALAPFMPFLAKAGAAVGEAFQEALDKHGGDVAWQAAQKAWEQIKAYLGDDDEVQGASTMVAAKPESESRQKELASVLAERLAKDPKLAEDLFNAVGGAAAIQRVRGGHDAWIQDVEQHMARPGLQEAIGGDRSRMIGITQRQGGAAE